MSCICGSGGSPVAPEKVCQVTGLTEAEKIVIRDTWYKAKVEWDIIYGPEFFTSGDFIEEQSTAKSKEHNIRRIVIRRLFVARLFKRHKDILNFFVTEEAKTCEDLLRLDYIKKHVVIFGGAVTSLVDNLSKTDILVEAIKRLTDNHVGRGVTVRQFELALGEMVKFMNDKFGPGKKVKKSWEKVTKVIIQVIKDHVKTL